MDATKHAKGFAAAAAAAAWQPTCYSPDKPQADWLLLGVPQRRSDSTSKHMPTQVSQAISALPLLAAHQRCRHPPASSQSSMGDLSTLREHRIPGREQLHVALVYSTGEGGEVMRGTWGPPRSQRAQVQSATDSTMSGKKGDCSRATMDPAWPRSCQTPWSGMPASVFWQLHGCQGTCRAR